MQTVSVIIPTYNRARYLDECLRSVFSQTFKDFEVIVVDDGSIEDVEGLIRKNYSGRVIYLRHSKNLGNGLIFPAVLTGLKAAKGRYILLIGDDDLLEREHLETAMGVFRDNPEAGCFSPDMTQIDSDGNIRLKESHFTAYLKERAPWFKLKDKILTMEDVFMYALGTSSSGVVFKREMIDEIGFYDERYGVAADWEYAFRVTASRFKLYFCSMPLLRYRCHSTNISKDYYGVAKLKLTILAKALSDFPRLKEGLGRRKVKERMGGLIKEFMASSLKSGRYAESMGVITKLFFRAPFLFL